jgi:hypothetical protein
LSTTGNIPETTVELLASVVLESSNQQLLLGARLTYIRLQICLKWTHGLSLVAAPRAALLIAGLELIRALVTGGSGNDSGASELYPEGGGRKVRQRSINIRTFFLLFSSLILMLFSSSACACCR